jgi:hypothetical protein
MKKNLIVIVIIATGAMGVAAYSFLRPNISSAQATSTNPVLPASSLPDYLGTTSYVFGTTSTPTGATFQIGTAQGEVTVNNFYNADPPVDTSQYMIIKITQNYLIDYDPTDSSFWIGVSGIPFTAWQSTAEQDFLTTLGVSQSDACKLNVVEGIIYSANNPDDGMSFPMSFCGTPAQ